MSREKGKMTEYQGILIGGEAIDGKLTPVTRELLHTGRRLGDSLSQTVSILFVGKDIRGPAEEAVLCGAEKYCLVDGPSWDLLHPDLYAEALFAVTRQIKPFVILLGQTDLGRDTAPRLAARLGSAVTLDCTELSIDPETTWLHQTRPVYGGKAMAVWVSGHRPQVISMRPRAAPPAEPDTSRKGGIIDFDVYLAEEKVKGVLLETVREPVRGIPLEEAKVIVAGGGGIGGSEGFQMLEEMARLFGGAVGASRVPCDEGWVPFGMEIGQTGHIVSPNLYIAVGISGASQHIVGCSSSNYVVAINRDPEAPIFKVADFGVVVDYRKIVPTIIGQMENLTNP